MTRKEKRCDGRCWGDEGKERTREDKRQRGGIRDPQSKTDGLPTRRILLVRARILAKRAQERARTIDNLMMRLRTMHANLLGILLRPKMNCGVGLVNCFL